MTDELAGRVRALADEVAGLRPALDRAAPAGARHGAPGRLARLADAATAWQDAAWTAHSDTARRLERELTDLSTDVRAAGAAYREAEQPRGGVA